jgi:hypothetical protein
MPPEKNSSNSLYYWFDAVLVKPFFGDPNERASVGSEDIAAAVMSIMASRTCVEGV